MRLRIVQANIDQAEKWRPENSEEIFTSYLELTRVGRSRRDRSIVVWPETAVPFLLADDPEALALIGDVLPQETSLLVGSARLVEEGDAQGGLAARRIYNSLLVVDDKGAVLDAYDKRHLVPFGEYLPFQDFLESLGFMQMTGVRGGFSEGAGSLLLNVPGAPQARPLICYEIIFPDEIASRTGGQAGCSTSPTMRGSVAARGPTSTSIKRACAPSSKDCRSSVAPIPASLRRSIRMAAFSPRSASAKAVSPTPICHMRSRRLYLCSSEAFLKLRCLLLRLHAGLPVACDHFGFVARPNRDKCGAPLMHA